MKFMLKYFTLTLTMTLLVTHMQGQNVFISNGSANACGGTFLDTGVNGGGYGTNENFEFTICTDSSNPAETHVTLLFNPLDLGGGDLLCFFDGDDTSAPSLGCSNTITNTEAFVIQASAVNPSGCITVTFVSDNMDGGEGGWSAGINCIQQCQTVLSSIVSSDPPISPPDTGYIDICPGDLVTFSGAGEYPQNNFIYAQSDGTSSFSWDFGDGTSALGPNVQHVYNNPGGYIVQLTITDVNGCVNTNFISQRIRVSGPPEFNLVEDLSPIVCVNDTIAIYTAVNDTLADISINPGAGSFQAGGTVADSVCVPDGTGEIYYSDLELNDFSPGQTLNNIDDLLGVCVDMEHSFLGDLEIMISCPSGQTVILHEFSNFSGGGYYLGEPIDGNAQACQSDANVGNGATYCWTPNATNGTWLQSAGLVNADNQLPPGDYSSFQSLDGLLGCELNGVWTISIEDNWNIDDGVIFSWNLALNQDIFPSLETYDLNIVNAEWLDDPSIIVNNADSMVASPQFPGSINYVFEATDNFGCVYDTTVSVQVLPQTDPNCYNCSGNLAPMADVTICDDGENTQLSTTLENVELTTTTFQDTPNAPFSFNATPPSSPLTSVINVSGLPYNFIDASSIESICMNISHPTDLDVLAILIAPNGTTVELTNGGTVFGQDYTQTCFSPSATTPISAGSPPYTGEWLPNGDLSTLVGSQANGNWTLSVADQYPAFESGILLNWSITFSLANNLTWTWSPADGLSCTDCGDPIAQPTTTTAYTVTATDQYNCSFTESVTVSVIDCNTPCNLAASLANSTDATCSGAMDGTATINATGQVGSVTYVLDGVTTQIDDGFFSGLNDGPHQVVLTDGNNCSVTVDFVINTPNAMALTLTPTNISCNGGNDGSITSLTSGGDGNYTYNWSSGSVTSDISNLTAMGYTLTVTDGNGCQVIDSLTLTEPDAILLTTSDTPVNCFGGNDGTASVTASGGNGTLSYLWDNSEITNSISNLSAGTYTVTVTDDNMCTNTAEVTITEPATPVTINSITQSVTACFGADDSEATVVASGGTGVLSYNWSSGGTTDVETNLAPGDYTVTVTDENSCSTTATINIVQYDELIVSVTGIDVACFAGADGSVTASATGGTPGYTYLWDDPNNQTTATATGLVAGTYNVTVTDLNNCTSTNTISIVEPVGMTYFDVPGNILCHGDNTGFAGIFVTGGVYPYEYEWSNGVTAVSTGSFFGGWVLNETNGCMNYTTTAVQSFADTICVDITDGNNSMNAYYVVSTIAADNCMGDMTDTDGDGICDNADPAPNDACSPNAFDLNNNGTCDFDEPDVIQTVYMEVPMSETMTACLDLPAAFDAANTSYSYCQQDDGHVITSLLAGDYTVTVTDNNGCTFQETVTVTEPDELNATLTTSNVSCFGGNDGSSTAAVTGGIALVAPYTYLWSDGASQTTDQASNLIAGDYTVTVTDNNGCTVTQTTTITEPATPVQITSITQTNTSCAGLNNGSAEVIATGGTDVFTYLWSNNATTSTPNGLAPGTYTVTVTDSNGCTAEDQLDIVEYGLMSVSATSTDVGCFGASTGTASVTLISGGAGTGNLSEYSYTWSGTGQTTSTVTNLAVGNYTVTVTDIAGCTATATVTIAEPTELFSSITSGNLSCSDTADGFATAEATGGTPPYTYEWDANAGFATTETVNNLAPGGYNVTVSDANGCQSVAFTFINPVIPVNIDFTVVDNICHNGFQGSITANVGGGTPPFTYIWSTGDTTTTNLIEFLPTGIYTVTVSDANMCTTTASTPLFHPDELLLDVDVQDVSCYGDRDGSILLTGTGGTFPYTYSFNGGPFGGSEYLGGLFPGYYDVAIQDANGCITSVDSLLVGEPLPLVAEIYPSSDVIYLNLGDSVNLAGDVFNAVGGQIYTWDALYSDTTLSCDTCQFPIVYTLENDRYTVTVTDDNGCTATEDVEIIVPRERQVFVPGGFTPNGDSVNDVLMVHGKTGTRVLTFRVYDRWGELMFRADDYDINTAESAFVWNGDFKGKPMNSAVFVWYVEVEYIDGRQESFEGNTTLLR